MNYRKCCFVRKMMPYNKLLTNFTCSGPYWGILALGRFCTDLATTSGQYSPVRPSRSVSKKLLLSNCISQCTRCLYALFVKYSTTRKNIWRYFTPKPLIRYMYSQLRQTSKFFITAPCYFISRLNQWHLVDSSQGPSCSKA